MAHGEVFHAALVTWRTAWAEICLALALCATTQTHAQNALGDFKHPLDGSKLSFDLKPGEVETPVLKKFKATGINDYRNNEAALARGKELYDQWCQVCHNTDASGRMGPSLIGKEHVYPQTASDAGMFSIIYAGASGAMQPFSKRDVTQDDILRIVAHVRRLDR